MSSQAEQYKQSIIDAKNMVMTYRLYPEKASEDVSKFQEVMSNVTYLLIDLQKLNEKESAK